MVNGDLDASKSQKVLRLNAVRSEFEDWFAARERRIVTDMVREFRGKEPPTYASLLAKVAAISELRQMQADMQRKLELEVDDAA